MELKKGVVIRSTGSWYSVRVSKNETIDCRIKGKFRNKGIKTTNPIAVGDNVVFELYENGDGVVAEILPRKNYIIRKSVNLSKQAHIIASNIDQAVLVVTISNPTTSTGFIDRFLITAEAYHIKSIIIFNKVDLYSEKEYEKLQELKKVYEVVGYDCYAISAFNPNDVNIIENLLLDKVTLLSGHSGVGKSTLINSIDSTLDLKTGSVSDAHSKGKHTTTFAEMFELEGGGFIVDTPGIKGFGLVDFNKEELSHYFIEFKRLLQHCKFNNCQHINEPKCKVLESLKLEGVARFRYENYLAMWNDDSKETFRSFTHKL